MKSGMLLGNGILRKAAVQRKHLVERSDLVALAELRDAVADALDVSGNIVALVGAVPFGLVLGDFPVLRVRARHHHSDEHLARLGGRDVGIPNRYRDVLADEGFFHCDLDCFDGLSDLR